MPRKPISLFDPVASLNDDDEIPVVQSGVTKRCSVAQLLAAAPLLSLFGPLWTEAHSFTDVTDLVNGGAPEVLNDGARTIFVPEDMTVVVIGELLVSRANRESPLDYQHSAGIQAWLGWDDGSGEQLEAGSSTWFQWVRQSIVGGLGNDTDGRTIVSVWTIPLTQGDWTLRLKAYSLAGNPTLSVNRVGGRSKWTALGIRSVLRVTEERVTEDGQRRVTEDGETRII